MKTFLKFVDEKIDRFTSKDSKDTLIELLSVIKAHQATMQNCHWLAKDENYYGNHLLFERLYGKADAEIDSLAEKIVGYFGDTELASETTKRSQFWIDKWAKAKDLIEVATNAEQDLQRAIKQTYETLKEQEDMPLGLDDFLMAMANDHETNLYLLSRMAKSERFFPKAKND